MEAGTPIIGEALDLAIKEAEAEGDFRLLATLYSDLVARYPDVEKLRLDEIVALQRCGAWPEVDEKALLTAERFPESVAASIIYARNPIDGLNWQVAIDRLVDLRARLGASAPLKVAATVFDQFYCYDEMGDDVNARKLITEWWDALKSRNAIDYGMRGEIFSIGPFVPAGESGAYRMWSMEVLREPIRSCYVKRLDGAAENGRWIARNAANVDIVSLGQNCLPWVTLNRWGLRPDSVTMSAFSVFDLLGFPNDGVAAVLEQDFEPLLNPAALNPTAFPNKVPVLANTQLGTLFFHERGPWWEQGGWIRLHLAYHQRIERFRRKKRFGKRLYVHCICGACDLKRLIQAYANHLDGPDSRLLIINVLKDPIDVRSGRDRVVIRNVPYPEDYGWNSWLDYDSPRGHAFEAEVVESVKRQLDDMKDWRALANRWWNRAPARRGSALESIKAPA